MHGQFENGQFGLENNKRIKFLLVNQTNNSIFGPVVACPLCTLLVRAWYSSSHTKNLKIAHATFLLSIQQFGKEHES